MVPDDKTHKQQNGKSEEFARFDDAISKLFKADKNEVKRQMAEEKKAGKGKRKKAG